MSAGTSVVLEGVAWGHTRGLVSVIATAQRYAELHAGMAVRWHSRSLHDFGHADVEELSQRFDLIVIDHPWMGYAAEHGSLLPFDGAVPPATVAAWRDDAVGGSFASYLWRDRLWAAPIDAASPAAAVRLEDGIPAVEPPADWPALLALAREGRVLMPCFPPDLLLHLMMLLASRDAAPFEGDEFAPPATAAEEMERLRELVELVPTWCDGANPIAVFEALASGGRAGYCPFAYSYSTYGRAGYAHHRLRFLDLPTLPGGAPLRGVLGGTGLAVSRRCRHPEVAFDYAAFTASARVQAGPFAYAGGQPARASAWVDDALDAHTGGFFSGTRPAMERAWTRPRYYGYPYFQEAAGVPLLAWMRGAGTLEACLDEMNEIYRHSRALRHPQPARPPSAR